MPPAEMDFRPCMLLQQQLETLQAASPNPQSQRPHAPVWLRDSGEALCLWGRHGDNGFSAAVKLRNLMRVWMSG